MGRPVIYMRPRLENTTNYDNQIRLLVYTLEKANSIIDQRTDLNEHQMVWIIDFKGYSAKNAPPMSVSRKTLDVLSSHNVEVS